MSAVFLYVPPMRAACLGISWRNVVDANVLQILQKLLILHDYAYKILMS